MAESTPAPEFTERQITVLRALSGGPQTAKAVAEAIESGSDSRGAAQTMRRMPELIERNADGEYKLTRKGQNAVKKLSA